MAWDISGDFSTHNTGDLITAAIWNQNVVSNPAYLKGTAGVIEYEAGGKSDTHASSDTGDDWGASDKFWNNIYGRVLHAGRMRFGGVYREQRLVWEPDTFDSTNYQASFRTTDAGSVSAGGTGQLVLAVTDNDGTGDVAGIEQETEQNNALNNGWQVSKRCYGRFEFAVNARNTTDGWFVGFRQTPGDLLPDATAESLAGFRWNGAIGVDARFAAVNADGTAGQTNTMTDVTLTTGSRHIIEVYCNSTTNVEFWLDGVLKFTETDNLPTGNLEWAAVALDNAGSSANVLRVTLGEFIFQEDL